MSCIGQSQGFEGFEAVPMSGVGQPLEFEGAPVNGIGQSWELEGAGAGVDWGLLGEEFLVVDWVYEPQFQNAQDTAGVLADKTDEARHPGGDYGGKENGSNDKDKGGTHDWDTHEWVPAFPLSAYMADTMKQQTTTATSSSSSGAAAAAAAAAAAPTPSATAAPELTQASSSSSSSSPPELTKTSPSSPGLTQVSSSPPGLTQASASSASGGGSPGTPGGRQRQQQRRFVCAEPTCSQAFEVRKDLQRHVNSKHGRVTMACPDCGAVIKGSRMDNLRRHQRIKHGSPEWRRATGPGMPPVSRLLQIKGRGEGGR
ncbi:hypothetical protein GGTG_11393 [Gaeumannomyces tritici R3-111a-1]|uniref:C2H2-type domain-containing protein n=1 Tax=Gaeumannomyces tritici (strain R3-111a-1) TaxID=644352 RepID=J3PD20_GAET3|nr:hypothetical protein GGTG_11393 [Gaeumannomyces tritici R3-111a-1]EJT70365.1 hypothetical protein GGTG_11393 [Gaeumannomyces tritici R3-111a-1]